MADAEIIRHPGVALVRYRGPKLKGAHAAPIAMAPKACKRCGGYGEIPLYRGATQRVCDCVWRRIFRVCWSRYVAFVVHEQTLAIRVTCERTKCGRRAWGFKGVEYIADLSTITIRNLNAWDQKVFELYFVRGLNWRGCCTKLGCARGEFYHDVYRIEAELGKAFTATEPYSLWPASYFGGRMANKDMAMAARQ